MSASAESDVFNEDISTLTNVKPIASSSVEQSGNKARALATGNQAGNSLTLGDDGTANSNRTGALVNVQSSPINEQMFAEVDQSVRVVLDLTDAAPVQQSSIVQDGNETLALARSNVAINTVTVDGANINGGSGNDAAFTGSSTDTLTGSGVLASSQVSMQLVVATNVVRTNQQQVFLSSTNQDGTAISASSVSQSNNASEAVALANVAVNSVTSGANAASVDATTALGNTQANGNRRGRWARWDRFQLGAQRLVG